MTKSTFAALVLAGISALSTGVLAQNTLTEAEKEKAKQAMREKMEQEAKKLAEKRQQAVDGAKQEAGHAADPAMAGMEDWAKANMPGKQHAELVGGMVGEWNVDSKMWMAPGQPAMESTAKASCKPTMGGRFVQQDYSGDMMGMAYKGSGTYGFNNATGKYECVWMDSVSTGMMMFVGDKQANGDINWTCDYIDPMTKEKKSCRAVSKFVNRDQTIFEMYEKTTDGAEFMTMQLTYHRAKSENNNTMTK